MLHKLIAISALRMLAATSAAVQDVPNPPLTVEIELGATKMDFDATAVIMDGLVQLSEPQAAQSGG